MILVLIGCAARRVHWWLARLPDRWLCWLPRRPGPKPSVRRWFAYRAVANGQTPRSPSWAHCAKPTRWSRATRSMRSSRVFRLFNLDTEQKRMAKDAFNRGKQPDFDLDAAVDSFAAISRGRGPLLQLFLQVQCMAIAADGKIHPAEHEMLVRIATRLGLTEADVLQLEALLRAATRARLNVPVVYQPKSGCRMPMLPLVFQPMPHPPRSNVPIAS